MDSFSGKGFGERSAERMSGSFIAEWKEKQDFYEKEEIMKKTFLGLAMILVLVLVLFPVRGDSQMGPGYGYGMGPGMMGPGYGYGMMGPGMMGPGYGYGMMGPGMMGPGYGYGMMGPGMMGPGYGYGMMGPGMMCPGYGYGPQYQGPGKPMEEKDAKEGVENYLQSIRNPNLKLGDIKDKGSYFEADIVTKKGNSLVDKIYVDKNTGWMRSAY